MEFKELVASRRSIRKYKEGTSIDRKCIEEIIAFSQQAPSWKNSQTGRYYIAISKEKIDEIREKGLPSFNQNNSQNAAALVVTTFVKKLSGFDNDKNAVNEAGDEWGAYDLGLQNELFILKARELGLDTLIMGIRDNAVLRDILNIPEEEEIMAVIALGYRDIEPNMPARKPLEEIAKFY